MSQARVGLLAGPIGVGKTTVAERVIDLARRRGLTCAGLLAPAMLDDSGQKVGIWAVSVDSGEKRTLARTDQSLGGPSVGPYSFDAESLSWALGQIEAAVGAAPRLRHECRHGRGRPEPRSLPHRCGPPPVRGNREGSDPPAPQRHRGPACDLLLIDEIGPLELDSGMGLAPVLPRLAAAEVKRSLVLVRDSLLAELQARLGPVEQIVFHVSQENRDRLAAQIVNWLI